MHDHIVINECTALKTERNDAGIMKTAISLH